MGRRAGTVIAALVVLVAAGIGSAYAAPTDDLIAAEVIPPVGGVVQAKAIVSGTQLKLTDLRASASPFRDPLYDVEFGAPTTKPIRTVVLDRLVMAGPMVFNEFGPGYYLPGNQPSALLTSTPGSTETATCATVGRDNYGLGQLLTGTAVWSFNFACTSGTRGWCGWEFEVVARPLTFVKGQTYTLTGIAKTQCNGLDPMFFPPLTLPI
jgi:hypothetical protein